MPGIQDYLRQLGDNVRAGQPLRDALTSSRVNAILGAIKALARGDNISSGVGIRKAATSSGVILSSDATNRSGAREFVHPFEVVYGTEDGTVQVISDSWLYDQLAANEPQAFDIKKLDTDLDVAPNEGVFLHGAIEKGKITSVTAEVWPLVLESPYDEIITFDEEDEDGFKRQTDFYYRLAEVLPAPEAGEDTSYLTGFALSGPDGEKLWVYQICFTNLRIMTHCVDGVPVLYPVPA